MGRWLPFYIRHDSDLVLLDRQHNQWLKLLLGKLRSLLVNLHLPLRDHSQIQGQRLMPGINLQQGPCISLDLELILGKPKTAIACFGAGDAFIYVSTDGTAYGSTTARSGYGTGS